MFCILKTKMKQEAACQSRHHVPSSFVGTVKKQQNLEEPLSSAVLALF